MIPPPTLSRAEFEQLLAEHQRLITLTNQLEFCLYRLAEAPPCEPVTECQQAAGALIGALRSFLFRQDQQVLPFLEHRIQG
jgi:hypothetical protein